MPAHTAIASFTDTTYAISASLPATYDAAGYASTEITYTEIGGVEKFLLYGAKRSVSEFRPISGSVEYIKGAPAFGSGDMVMKDVPANPGQVLLAAAEVSPNHHSLKVTYADGEIHYLDFINSGWELSEATEGTGMKRTATLNICRRPVVVAAV